MDIFPCPLGKETPYIFSKFNALNMNPLLMWILSMTPSVSIIIEFDCINILRKLALSTGEYKVSVILLFDYKS